MLQCRLLVADDHEVVRHGLRALLEAQPQWTVCGEASSGREAVTLALTLQPDVAILDIGMPDLNGLNATREIVQALPTIKVLLLSLYESEQMVQAVLDAGARGYLLKSDASRNLVKAVEAIKAGRCFFSPRFSHLFQPSSARCDAIGRPLPVISLTPREREVVRLLGEGKTTREVAVMLNMAVKTAETHRAHIMHKLDLHSITDLILYAVRNRLISIDAPMAEAVVRQLDPMAPSPISP